MTVSKTPNTTLSLYKEITGVTVIAKSVSTEKLFKIFFYQITIVKKYCQLEDYTIYFLKEFILVIISFI